MAKIELKNVKKSYGAVDVIKGIPLMIPAIGKDFDFASIAAQIDEARRLREEAEALLAQYQRKEREAQAVQMVLDYLRTRRG